MLRLILRFGLICIPFAIPLHPWFTNLCSILNVLSTFAILFPTSTSSVRNMDDSLSYSAVVASVDIAAVCGVAILVVK